jgi:hypothetical protein
MCVCLYDGQQNVHEIIHVNYTENTELTILTSLTVT